MDAKATKNNSRKLGALAGSDTFVVFGIQPARAFSLGI